jgi:hypothetical protein
MRHWGTRYWVMSILLSILGCGGQQSSPFDAEHRVDATVSDGLDSKADSARCVSKSNAPHALGGTVRACSSTSSSSG